MTVVGTTEFQMQSVPRLYRNSTTTINAKLIDNALQPMRDAGNRLVSRWQKGVNITDSNGVVQIPFEVNASDRLAITRLHSSILEPVYTKVLPRLNPFG